MPYNIAVIVGSLRRDSFNLQLARGVTKLAPTDFSFREVPLGDLPLYNQDDDAAPSEAAHRFKEQISQSDGLLFATPEYNRSIPGVLKNALDHASRPYGKNTWAGKPAGVIGISVGVIGTAVAQQHLRTILAYLDVPTLGQPEVFVQAKDNLFEADGSIGPTSRDFLQRWMDRYAEWVRQHAPKA